MFNVTADPCEQNNVAFQYPTVITMLESTLDAYDSTAVPPGNKPIDPRADPRFWGYTWTNWMDYVDPMADEELEEEEDEQEQQQRKITEGEMERWLLEEYGRDMLGFK